METIGVDVGGTTVKAGLVDEAGTLLRTASRPTDTRRIERLLGTIVELVDEVSEGSGAAGVGIGLPGPMARETGEVLVAPNIPCLAGVNVETALAGRISCPVTARNDADMSAWGEFAAGAGVGSRHMICLTLGTGVGSGIVIDGKLFNGAHGFASEAGHLTVEPDGPPCPCGSHGCLEAIASATGIVAMARHMIPPSDRRANQEPWTAARLHEAALGGHPGAKAVFERVARALGIALAALINLFNPEVIVIGGGVARAEDLLLAPARAEARSRAFSFAYDACRIVPARLGPRAGVVGSALFARRLNA
jgi:glucokinase